MPRPDPDSNSIKGIGFNLSNIFKDWVRTQE
jgi:hypothetical protein